MIREEYLESAAAVNLIMTRNLRDAAVLVQTGYRSSDLGHAYAYERIRLYLELLMRDAASAATGLVKPRTAFVSEYTFEAESRTAEQTGVAIAADITPAENRALIRSAPPVGKLPGLYERTKLVAEKGARLAKSLTDSLSALYDGAACCKLLHAMPLSGIEALSELADEARAAFSVLGEDRTKTLSPSETVLNKLIACLGDSLDPIYEAELKAAVLARASDSLKNAAAAAVKGAKCNQPPLMADLILRYSAI